MSLPRRHSKQKRRRGQPWIEEEIGIQKVICTNWALLNLIGKFLAVVVSQISNSGPKIRTGLGLKASHATSYEVFFCVLRANLNRLLENHPIGSHSKLPFSITFKTFFVSRN